jgi:transposase InsO family protein
VWIPDDAAELQLRLCVVAHAGASGHRGTKTTARALEDLFWWRSLPKDVAMFVSECMHCMATATGKIPRPLDETLWATKPNEQLIFDFLSMTEGAGGLKYVLVLKDNMSGYVELVACVRATSEEVYQALLDWFKRFGVVRQWVSDQGAHFRNQVVAELQRALGAHHHFTTAYTPWANGTVDVVNREVLKAVKALLSERRLRIEDWPRVLPVVQGALNQMPADRLNGKSPLTAFTALPGGTQLTSILHPSEAVTTTVDWVDAQVNEHLATVRAALDGMHAEMIAASEKRKRAARERVARRQGVTLTRFTEGYFVLAATATGKNGNTLSLVWRGPKRVVRALNDYTFEVQDLIEPFAISIRHAARLQLYRDAARGQVDELTEQAIHGEGGHLVEAIRACRLSPDTHQWEVHVKWFGLDEVEASWEPAEVIQEDVPVLFSRFVDETPDDPARHRMKEALVALARRQPTAASALPVPKKRRRKQAAPVV